MAEGFDLRQPFIEMRTLVPNRFQSDAFRYTDSESHFVISRIERVQSFRRSRRCAVVYLFGRIELVADVLQIVQS